MKNRGEGQGQVEGGEGGDVVGEVGGGGNGRGVGILDKVMIVMAKAMEKEL